MCSLCLFVGCNRYQSDAKGSDAVQQVEPETVPPESRILQAPIITRGTASVHADWDIEVSSSIQEYFSWVTPHMETKYHVISRTDSELVLGRTEPGDRYLLQLTGVRSGSNSVIRAHLSAGGD